MIFEVIARGDEEMMELLLKNSRINGKSIFDSRTQNQVFPLIKLSIQIQMLRGGDDGKLENPSASLIQKGRRPEQNLRMRDKKKVLQQN